ncbi:LysR family transcriptional regulator [Motiliproteus sp. MSK22-1]|uniref:LysR family transcriptional regulator n=1 Tax=Motiliproteus sp. MSK22-1 TaxID=1897630 RepID=UPI0009762378|nr:LysR family transcriptional regulator [Motiliproteus sp. MSK22-1]OMH38243.1 LysR family transcriptional regulator [Motiliproteus sp. MSK22-1]
MYLRSLRYFVAVYEELSLSAASKRCFVAQPSISTAIQQLESELECPLFLRHSKGVTPTVEGTRLYPHACKVLSDVKSIKELFRDEAEHLPLRLALMPYLSGKKVSGIIKELIQNMPGLDLTLVDITQESDVRIISSTILESNEAFHKLWVDRYVLVVPVDHPLVMQETVVLEHLNNLPFISRKPCDITDTWQFAVQKEGVNLNIKATVRTEEYALDLVAAGLGASIVPRDSVGDRKDLVIREVDNLQLERVVGLAYLKDKSLPQGLLAAIDKIQEDVT